MYQQAETLLASVLEGNPSGRVRLFGLASGAVWQCAPRTDPTCWRRHLQAGSAGAGAVSAAGEAAVQAWDYRSATSHPARAGRLNPQHPTRTRAGVQPDWLLATSAKGSRNAPHGQAKTNKVLLPSFAIASVLAEKRQFGEAMQALDDAAENSRSRRPWANACCHPSRAGEPGKARSELEQVLTLRRVSVYDQPAGRP